MTKYNKKLSQMVKNELDRLQRAGGELGKRHDRFYEYISRILENPLNTDYLKNSLDQYRAAPYKTGQYRVFFEIIDEAVDYNPTNDQGKKIPGKFVHFVWMNNENCKHDSSKGEHDPCYREFKNLKENNQIEAFKRPLLPKGYINGGEFGKTPALYPKYYDNEGVAQSQAVVTLSEETESEFRLYKVEGLISTPDSKEREFELLQNVLNDAKSCGVVVEWEIIRDHNFDRFKAHATQLGMKSIDNDEVWEVFRSI